MMKKKRCFVGIFFPKAVIDEILRLQDFLKKEKIFYGKFVEVNNFHLTLKFLGEIDFDCINEVCKRLEGLDFNKFCAGLGEVGVFSEAFIRILWVSVLGEELFSLQEEIDNKLGGLFEKEKRFMSHLTIARVKSVRDKREFLKKIKEFELKRINFLVEKVCLAESNLSSKGAEYKIIKEFLLG